MSQLLRFPSSIKRDPAIEIWMREHSNELEALMKLIETAYTDMKGRVKAE